MNPLSILVADDEDSIRSLLQHFLTSSGHRVVVVSNAREACDAMSKQGFDLVITDVLMPEGDGLDLITELRKKQSNARIIAMSGGGRYLEGSDYLKLAKGLGAHTAMMKPFTWQQLQEAMQDAFGEPPQPRDKGETGASAS
jgi:DNA-binding NtrC family response regulator